MESFGQADFVAHSLN